MIVFPRSVALALSAGENVSFANNGCGRQKRDVSRSLLTFPQSTPPTTTTTVSLIKKVENNSAHPG